MFWSSEPDEEEEALLCSPALMARRASESWIVAPPVEVPNHFTRSISCRFTSKTFYCLKSDANNIASYTIQVLNNSLCVVYKKEK